MPVHSAAATAVFPFLEPRISGMLELDARHRMYWEECGSSDGVPVVFLHGGPGAGSTPDHRRFFDPRFYRIIVFDQRGSGRSLPHGEIADNTTPLLVADMERLRVHLGIERWAIFGGSWGSTLALAYGAAHHERCLAFILRGIFLGSRDEIDWFLYGLRRFFPEAWRAFVRDFSESERTDLLKAYHRRLVDPDPQVHGPAARAWSTYEGSCSTLRPNGEVLRHSSTNPTALSLARIEAHYFMHDIFMPPGALLAGVERIRHLPCWIVQGRYDAVCPIATADLLARAWPQARYVVVPDAGHSAWEPGILAALLHATEALKDSCGEAGTTVGAGLPTLQRGMP
ncbi:MAG: prolyl aminopeptidase [Burkholderiales bacterium]|nr:prolyl aminopeptidase [Burkholderiales bacterium]